MIHGAEGLIGVVNIIVLLGVLATLGLIAVVLYKRPHNWWLLSFLLVLALPSWGAGIFFVVNYIQDKPYNDAFERNNSNFKAMSETLNSDDLVKFKQALNTCGQYCIGTPNPGARKYDTLLVIARYANATKIIMYLQQLNEAEQPSIVLP